MFNPESKPIPKENTPGIADYEIKVGSQWARLYLDLAPCSIRRSLLTNTFRMLEAKADKIFDVKKPEFYLPAATTISWETEQDQINIKPERTLHLKKWHDEKGYLNGYEMNFEGEDGRKEFRVVSFLANGVKIVISATKQRKFLRSYWLLDSAEVSIGISEKVSEEEAKKLLEAFILTPY